MNSIVKIFSISAIASLMLMSKCGKDRPKVDDETQTIEDNIVSEQEFMRIMPTTNDRAIKQKGIGGSGKVLDPITTTFKVHNSINGLITDPLTWTDINNNSPLALINSLFSFANGVKIFIPTVDAVKITVEYDSNIDQADGSRKSGKVITTMLQKNGAPMPLFGEPNSSSNSVLDNYKVGSILYNGNIDVDRDSKTVMRLGVNNGTCDKIGEWSSTFSNVTKRKVTWMKGANHPNDSVYPGTNNYYTFDEYKIEEADPNGAGSIGTSRNGLAYSIKIISPITFRTDAKFGITGGIVELTPDGKKKRTIDYSQITSGIVTFTVDGNSFTINL
jgi:hypothetical protein